MIAIAIILIAEVAFVLLGLLIKWESLSGDDEFRLETLDSLAKASLFYVTVLAVSIVIVNELMPGSPFSR